MIREMLRRKSAQRGVHLHGVFSRVQHAVAVLYRYVPAPNNPHPREGRQPQPRTRRSRSQTKKPHGPNPGRTMYDEHIHQLRRPITHDKMALPIAEDGRFFRLS